jgi:peptidoglycan/xylan/chitin deacetylase (PgdA/CDA1 family)
LTNGAPLLAAVGFPATAFINSGFIDTSRVYPHDAQGYPFIFPNLTSGQVREWVQLGFEIGNHTANHVDFGVHPLEEVKREIVECEKELRNITGQEINLFSFPFGNAKNIRPEVVECIKVSGYLALFSAYGGFVTSKTDVYDIPRLGANGDLNPLVLLLETEGLAPHQIALHARRIAHLSRKCCSNMILSP